MKKNATPMVIIVIFILSVLVGGLTVYLVQTSKLEPVLKQVNTNFRRTVIVQNINLTRGIIGVEVTNRGLASFKKFVLTVDERTNIYQQEPIFTDGIITSFTPLKTVQLEKLKVGSEVMVQIHLLEDGRLRAASIVSQSPFVGN